MKKFFTLIFALLSFSSMVAERDFLYIEDFKFDSVPSTIIVPVIAHFDCSVSGFQVDFELPDGLSIRNYLQSDAMVIHHLNARGEAVDYMPMFTSNQSHTRFIGLSSESDYDENGNFAGVAKWATGCYEIWYIIFEAEAGFRGGDLNISSVTGCGGDNRPWVHTCNGCYTNTTTKVTVAGIEPEPDPDPDPEEPTIQYQGYWLVAEGDTINFPRTIRLDLHDHKYDNQPFAYHFVIDGVSFGAQHDGVPTSIEVEDNILIATSHFDYTLEGGHSYYLTVWNGIPHYIFLTPIPENNGGADVVVEVTNDRQVKDIRYYDIMGREMKEPYGITIVVTTYTDGTTNTIKILK